MEELSGVLGGAATLKREFRDRGFNGELVSLREDRLAQQENGLMLKRGKRSAHGEKRSRRVMGVEESGE
jgi:hypothetical protein